jgi:hypothetical protein
VTVVDPDTWQDALTRRLRTLLRTGPLHRVEATKGHRSGQAFSDQDLRAIALRTLDITIEKMGLGTGATFDELREGLRPLIVLSAGEGIDHDQADGIADIVIQALLNESNRRQAFSEPYLALTPEHATRRVLSFHLLRERETADGTTVIIATTEGINLYAGMLEYPVEDAQIAEEAVLQAQVMRGRIADAVRTAQRARLRSIEYEQKIVTILETTRRDIRQVDWINDVLELLDSARGHVKERIESEREILRAVEKRLDTTAEPQTGDQLVTLRETITECVGRHLRLHERLISSNRFYLDEQERQAFRPRLAEPLPALEADVLRAALALPCGRLADQVDHLLAHLQAPRAPIAIRLVQLVDRLLAPRRNEREEAFANTDTDLEELALSPKQFLAEDHAEVLALLNTIAAPTSLSALLQRARDQALSRRVQKLLVLRVLGAYDPQASADAKRISVEACDDEPLSADHFFGDELLLRPVVE